MDEDSKPSSCLFVGIIVGMLLIIILSACGAVRVPRNERLLDVRKDMKIMRELRGDAPPPVVRGDPFILALKSSEDMVKAY